MGRADGRTAAQPPAWRRRGRRSAGCVPIEASASSIEISLPGLHHLEETDLQMKPRLQGKLQIAEQIERQLQVSRQIFLAERRRDARHLRAFRRARRDQPRIRAGNPCDQQVPQIARNLAREMLRTPAVALQFIHQREHRAAILLRQRRRNLRHRVERKRAQQRAHLRGFELVPAAGDRLIERRKRIAHRAFARSAR